ncbi:hypothetical protein chiPu_0005954 [Chiloscyllium punctatum]|uniref:Small monomeric GTPase n=1 Tax=Chiloscyllium punctatum TaxID=137246 RepID=A0A401SAW0_CHIPU|nr:hypothetical protein [Chiloscyllium punctatum]
MMAIRELKVCLLGDTGVGKSSIVCRFVQDTFDLNTLPTIGASFMTKTVSCGNELHKFLIWDTAGQERFHSLAPMYYRGSAAAVIVYDITNEDAQEYVKFINAIFVETSAKNAINVGELFERISQQIPPLDPSQHNNNGAFKVGRHKVQSGRRCC